MTLLEIQQKSFLLAFNFDVQNELSLENILLCPICLEVKQINKFTREHVPQKSIGGNILIYTCKLCNNSAGDSYEKHLSIRESHERGEFGTVKMILPDSKYTYVNLKKTESGWALDVKGKYSPHIEDFQNTLKHNMGKGAKFKVENLMLPSQMQVGRAYLKSLYLSCIAILGYKCLQFIEVQNLRLAFLDEELDKRYHFKLNSDFPNCLVKIKCQNKIGIALVWNNIMTTSIELNMTEDSKVDFDVIEFYSDLSKSEFKMDYRVEFPQVALQLL